MYIWPSTLGFMMEMNYSDPAIKLIQTKLSNQNNWDLVWSQTRKC